jgi:hypothetical protein
MMFEIVAQGVEAMPQMIPKEWDESTIVKLEEETFHVIFKDGRVSVARGDRPDAESIVQMTAKRFCDAIDGSTDFLRVWMDFAEPSDKSLVAKGSGLKLATLIDLLSQTYKSNPEFRKLLDEYKGNLTVK